jgi:hypothetical protein
VWVLRKSIIVKKAGRDTVMHQFATTTFVLLIVLSGGCASVPMSSLDEDAAAKRFDVAPDKSNIYFYRDEEFGGAIAMPVALDGKVAGKTAANTYFLWIVEPGPHEITSLTENTATLKINAEAGRNHFVWQEVKMGMWTARSQLHEVSEEVGRKGVMECKRIAAQF